MKRIALLILAFLLWIALAGSWDAQVVWTGIVVSVIVLLIMKEVPAQDLVKWLDPARYFWMIAYTIVLAYYIVKANLDVVYRVLHPDMPIRPGIVRVKTNLKTPMAITTLANSITLTPGTLTVNAADDGVLYIHWINVLSEDDDEAAKYITEKFEWFIKRIFE